MALSEFPKKFVFFLINLIYRGIRNIQVLIHQLITTNQNFLMFRKKEFDYWYDSVKNKNFDFKTKFKDFC